MIKSGKICIGDLKLTTRPGGGALELPGRYFFLIFPGGTCNVMFRRKSICDGEQGNHNKISLIALQLLLTL